MSSVKASTLELLFALDTEGMEQTLSFMDGLGDRYEKEIEGDVRMLAIGLLRLSKKTPADILGPGFSQDLLKSNGDGTQ